jgi:hypothetical protein
MLRMKVDPDIFLKTKDGENLRQVDPEMSMKTRGLMGQRSDCDENEGVRI